MTRIGVVDIGTNSTRLLVVDVEGGLVLARHERRSEVTRLGQGVDASGRLAEEAMERVRGALRPYVARMDELEAGRRVAVLTSAVRDAENGAGFVAEVRDGFRLEARTLSGEDEARLTFRGATSERPRDDDTPLVVIDIGGGSTEMVTGSRAEKEWGASTQMGVVRLTERHLHTDPPRAGELDALAADAAQIIRKATPEGVCERVRAAVAVAGTATSLGAIDLALEPYDPDRVHGHRLSLRRLEELLARLAALPESERRDVAGLHPDRAPTVVAGVLILREVLRAFGLDSFEVSEHDILRGVALDAAEGPRAT